MAYLDTKGEWPLAMAETMLRILIEESKRRGNRRISHNATYRPSTLTGLASMGATGVKHS
jgi:hypothetical protein